MHALLWHRKLNKDFKHLRWVNNEKVSSESYDNKHVISHYFFALIMIPNSMHTLRTPNKSDLLNLKKRVISQKLQKYQCTKTNYMKNVVLVSK